MVDLAGAWTHSDKGQFGRQIYWGVAMNKRLVAGHHRGRNDGGDGTMKRFFLVLPMAILASMLGVMPAGATAYDAAITSPTSVIQVAPGSTVDISLEFKESHVCGSYFANIYIGGTVDPLVHQEFEYVPGVDIPDVCGGPERTHNFTHTLAIPADATEGFYDVDLFVDEDYFGTRCCGDWAETRSAVIQVVAPAVPVGACPAEASGFVMTEMGHAADLNGDGFVCVKTVPGKGNQGNRTTVKDNDKAL